MNALTYDILVSVLIPIAFGCILPIVLMWLGVRQRKTETDARTQIVMAAIEKNPDMDIEELMKKISPKGKMLKEKLLTKLLWGCITSLLGIGLIALGIYLMLYGDDTDDCLVVLCFGVILLAVGGAFIINYGVGKKMLAKEIEAEEKNMTTQPKP